MGLLEQILTGLSSELSNEIDASIKSGSSRSDTRSSSARKRVSARNVVMPRSDESVQTTSQVLQVSTLPITLNLSDYQNAYSNANPEGDLFAARKFHELVDPAPLLAHEYNTSTSSIENVYGDIINGASSALDSTYLNSLISDAKESFISSAQADMVGHGEWRVIEASPHDWYTTNADRYKKIKIELNGDQNGSDSLGLMSDKSSPTTLTLGKTEVPLSAGTKLTHCELEYLFVRFIRPWMDFTLFKTNGWWLSGQRAGYCSSGSKEINSGILPLITTGMILVRSAKFEGTWDPIDQEKIDNFRKTSDDVFVGPYRLSNDVATLSNVSVAAWVNELVPFSPQATNPKLDESRVFHFSNKSQFQAICVVKWIEDGEKKKSRIRVANGNSSKVDIPKEVTDITVIIRAKNEGDRKPAFQKKYDSFVNKNFVIRGTFENPKVIEK